MSREWKPGDVALGTGKYVNGRLLICTYDDTWMDLDGERYNVANIGARPLVTIDPEDTEQVERLWKAWRDRAPDHVLAQDNLAAALREFAHPTPPKPEEPTGLGAVVEDAKGRMFVRVAERFDGWMKDADWQRIGGEINAVRNFGWSQISVVRVLSPGVEVDS